MSKKGLFVVGMLLGSLAALSSPALAAKQNITGNVTMFTIDDGGSTFYSGQVFQLGVRATATTCGGDPSGAPSTYIKLPEGPRGDQMRQTILTAMQLGKRVFASLDDSVKDGKGLCYAVGVGMVLP